MGRQLVFTYSSSTKVIDEERVKEIKKQIVDFLVQKALEKASKN